MPNLPKHWTTAPLNKIIGKRDGKPQQLKNKAFVGSAVYLDIDSVERNNNRFYTLANPLYTTFPNDILVLRTGGRNGLVLKAKEGIIGSTFFCLTPILINSTFLYHYLKFTEFHYSAERDLISDFWNATIPLPPVNEQTRIVQQLEQEVIKPLDKIEICKRELQNLKQQRQELFNKSVGGKLTEGGQEFEIGEVTTFIGSGTTPQGAQYDSKNKTIPFIRSQNVLINKLDTSDIVYLSEEQHNKTLRTAIQKGDVLLNITGTSIGRSAIVPDNFGKGNVNQHVCILRVKSDIILPKLLMFFFNSPTGQAIIKSLQKNLNREALNYSQIKSIKLSVGTLEEQHEIVRLIEQGLHGIQESEKTCQDELKDNEILLQSILEAAFTGKMSYPDPNDEPVEALLHRIATEREAFTIKIEELKKENRKMAKNNSKEAKIEKTILEVLQDAENNMETGKELWQKSKFSEDIDAFYDAIKEELKKNTIEWELTNTETAEPKANIKLKNI